MDELLSNLPYQGVGLGGLVVMLLILLFTGRIVVKYVYDEMVSQRDYWRDKYSEGEQVRRELVEQNTVLVEAVSTNAKNDEITVKLLQAIQEQTARPAGGAPDVES